jgi:DNA polymerase III subunit gamma/tau
MLADHCELVSQTGDAVTLRVGEAHKHLLDRAYQDKLVGHCATSTGPHSR